jgi:hypothetical protein
MAASKSRRRVRSPDRSRVFRVGRARCTDAVYALIMTDVNII